MTPLLSGGVGNEARGHYTVTGGGEKMPGSVVVGNPDTWQMAAAGAGVQNDNIIPYHIKELNVS